MGFRWKSKNSQVNSDTNESLSTVPLEQKRPKIIRRRPNQFKFVQNKPYLNAYQVLTGLSTLVFFIATYSWINCKETSISASHLSSKEVESIYDQVLQAFEERKKSK